MSRPEDPGWLPQEEYTRVKRERFLAGIVERRERLVTTLGERLAGWEGATLEIGCGHGHWLAAYAEAHPAERCVGIDLITRRIELANRKAGRRGLGNALFLKAEAGEFLAHLPAGFRFAKVFVLYNDPWPKVRHHKNRLLQPAFLAALAAACEPGAPLWFRTDHREYFDWSLARVSAHPAWRVEGDDAWPFEAPTIFQDLLAPRGEHHSFRATRVDAPGA